MLAAATVFTASPPLANQAKVMAGSIDAAAVEKAARILNLANGFSCATVTLEPPY